VNKKETADHNKVKSNAVSAQQNLASLQCLCSLLVLAVILLSSFSSPVAAAVSVDQLSGRLSVTEKDISSSAGLGLSRTLAQESMVESGLFGAGWMSDWEKRLTRIEQTVFIREAAGIVAFTGDSSGNVFMGLSGEKVSIERDGQAIRYIPDGTSEKYDADGRLVEIDLRNGNKVMLLYDKNGRLTQMKGPRGRFLEFTIDDKGKAVRVESSSGITVRYGYQGENLVEVRINDALAYRYTYDGGGRLVLIEQPQTGAVRVGYDNKGRVISREWADSAKERYDYDDGTNTVRKTNSGGGMTVIRWTKDYRQEEITDPIENKTTIWYSEKGKPVKITGSSGVIVENSYDALGRTTSVRDAAGRVTSFEYIGDSALLKSYSQAGQTRFDYQYDRQSNLTSITSGNKAIISYRYTPDGLVESVAGFQIPEIRFTYYPDGRLKSMGNALGNETHYEYDSRGNLIREISPIGGTTMRTYDSMNRITGKTDPAGGTTVFIYDPQGRIGSITYPDKKTTTYGYDRRGRLVSLTDRAGNTARYDYDNADYLVKVTHRDNSTEQFRYDVAGNRIEATGTSGLTRQYQYDGLGRIIREIVPGGAEISYVYDAAGNLTEMKDNAGSRMSYRYDASGRVTGITDSLGATAQYGYDSLGSLTQATDQLGNIKRYSYNPDGTLASVREATGDEGRYSYDSAGRLATIQSPNGGITSLAYDAMGNLARTKDPLGNEHRYTYDPAGRMTRVTNASGQTSSLSYDASGLLAERSLPDGRKMTYRYDPNGALAEEADGKFSIIYRYDTQWKLTGVEYTSIGKKTAAEYDEYGRRVRLVLPDGKAIRYEYDSFRRVSSVVLPDEKKIRFTYDAKGRQERIIYPNGITGYQEYDATGRVLKTYYRNRDSRTIFEEDYRYDLSGNLAEKKNAAGKRVSYRYDASGQITEADGPDSAERYVYSMGGNRKELRKASDTIRYTYDLADRMVKAGDQNFGYDAAGNLISRGAVRLDFDSNNKMVSATGPSGSKVAYGYSPSGDRVWRKDGKGTTYFIYDGLNLLQEFGEDFSVRATYAYAPGIDHPVAMVRDGKTFYYHADRLGNIRQLTDDQGAIAAEYEYDAFGKIINQQGYVQNPFTFTGRELDPETGLYYFRARYYDPELGRFLSVDPDYLKSLEPLELNPYLYVRNNPLLYTDPMGLGDWTPAEQLWSAENHYQSLLQQAADVGKPGGFASQAPPAQQAAWRNTYLESAEQFKAQAEYIRNHNPGVSPEPPPGYGGRPSPAAEAAESGAAPQAKGPTLAVPKPEGSGGGKAGTLAVKPGGDAAVSTPEVAATPESVSPSAAPTEGTWGSKFQDNLKGGLKGAALATAVFGGLNYKACRDYGNSHADCLKEFGISATIGAGATLLGAAVAVASPFVAAGAGAGGLVIGAGSTIGNLANASTVKQSRDLQQATQQMQSDERIQNVLASLRAKKDGLADLGKDFCDAQAGVSNNANEAKAVSDAAKKSVDTALGSMSSDVNDNLTKDCTAAQEKLNNLPQKISKAEEWIVKSIMGFEESINRLSLCSSQKSIDDADELLRDATALGLSADRKYREAESDITSIKEAVKKSNETANSIKRKMNSLETEYLANMEAVNRFASNARENAADAQDKLAKFNARKAELLGSASRLEGVINPSFQWELASIKAGIDAASLPCPDKLEDYKAMAKDAQDSVKVAWPKDLGGLGGLLSMAPAAAQKFIIDSALSTCGSLKAPTGNELNDAALGLVKLQDKTPDWLKTIADLRSLCTAKLYPPKPPAAGQKPPDEQGGQSTQKPPSPPDVTPPVEPPPTKPHVLSRFGVSCYPQEITEDGSSNCSAYGEYADNPNVIVELPGTRFDPGRVVSGSGNGGRTVSVTGTFEGASDTASVRVTKKADQECPPGGPWTPQCDPNTKGGGGTKPPVDPNTGNIGGPGQGTRPAQSTNIGGGQTTNQPTGYTTPAQPPGGSTGDTPQPPGTGPYTGPMGPCQPGYFLGPDNTCRRDSPCPPRFERNPVSGRCEPAGGPRDPSKPGSGPSSGGSGPVKPGKDGKCPPGCHIKKDGTGGCDCDEGGSGSTPSSSTTPPPSKPPTTSRPTGGAGG
jgi:RHS repeat-associated protein